MLMTCTINGRVVESDISPDTTLMAFLRSQGFLSVKQGCDTANCGLCTVWLDQKPVLSCSVLALRATGRAVTTIEGLQDAAAEFGRFMADQGAEQCGFCSPGLVMTVLAMVRELENPGEDEIRHYLSGNLCRCTGYMSQMRAIKAYLASRAPGQGGQKS